MYTPKRDFPNLLTKVVTNTTYTTPEGCGEIFLQNTGGANAKYKGNYTGSEWVTLLPTKTYQLNYPLLARLPIDIDATGTVVEVSVSL
jgi:hypothetical protein